ncbi:MAG: PAS domain S-box protein, partial [Acidobacteriota bacterium]
MLSTSYRRLAIGLACCGVAPPLWASAGAVSVPLLAAAAWPLVVFALLDLALYAVDRHRRLSLWLGLTVFTAGAMSLADAYGPGGVAARIAAALLPLIFAAAIGYFWGFAGVKPAVWLSRYQRGLIGLAAVVALLPAPWIDASAPARWLALVPFFVALGRLFWQILRRGDAAHLLPFGVGAGLVVVTWSAEMILRATDLGSARPLPALAWGGFWIGTLFLRIRRHRGAQDELGDLRQHLDSMVEDRTGELEEKTRQLEDELAERRLADEAMRMLEAAVEQSVDGIAVTDMNGGLQFINEAWAAMHGYEVFELLGYDLEIFHTPEQLREQVEPLLERLLADGAHQGEIEHRRRGGAVFPTWQTASVLRNPEGEAIGFVFIV